MPRLRNVRQEQAVQAFVKLGGRERRTKKNYRMVTMPNGSLLAIPSGVLKYGLLLRLCRRAGVTADAFEEALQ